MTEKTAPMNTRRLALTLLTLLALPAFFGSISLSAAPEAPMPAWPHENSGLTPDPAVHYGRLANGFRYVLMENGHPKDRVSLHLNVQAGSMHETENQRGLAHFLEHMLFNGSTHFPPGELVAYFQSIGMQFGPDANAHTGFSETVYDILLPDGTVESVEQALLVMADYAAGALLSPEEIDRERRVILAEKRSRDSVSYRTFESAMRFEFPDARISERLPIGSEAVIRSAGRELFKDFYDTWYRPEKMILVMVGDFDSQAAAERIEQRFGALSPRAPSRPEPPFGRIDHDGVKPFYHFEKEAGKTTVTLEVIEEVDVEHDSVALQKRQLIRVIGDRIVQNRLDRMLQQPEAPFTEASIGSGVFLHRAKIASISADCPPEKWTEALSVLERSLRQALQFGFTPGELDRVVKDIRAELANAEKEADTRESGELAQSIIRHLNRDRVFMSPRRERQILDSVLDELTLETVSEAFKKLWSRDHMLLLLTGNADLTSRSVPAKALLTSVYEKSRQTAVAPPHEAAAPVFPYLRPPAEGGAS